MTAHTFTFDIPDYLDPASLTILFREILERKTIRDRISRSGRPPTYSKDNRRIFKEKLFKGFRKWADRCGACGAKNECYLGCYGDGAFEMAETPVELLSLVTEIDNDE